MLPFANVAIPDLLRPFLRTIYGTPRIFARRLSQRMTSSPPRFVAFSIPKFLPFPTFCRQLDLAQSFLYV